MCSLMGACLKAPVLHRENFFSVNKGNITKICTALEKDFPDYSCRTYFNETYIFRDSLEVVKIKIDKKDLKLIYKTTGENGALFQQYQHLLKALKGKTVINAEE